MYYKKKKHRKTYVQYVQVCIQVNKSIGVCVCVCVCVRVCECFGLTGETLLVREHDKEQRCSVTKSQEK